MSHQEDFIEQLFNSAASIEDEVIEWRHHLHQYPELSNREEHTAAYIVERLQEFGIPAERIHTGIGGTGVVAVIEGEKSEPGKAALLRADIDALPVKEQSGVSFASQEVQDYPGGAKPVAHACGHDCHMSMLLGAAKVLFHHRAELNGTVYLAFQPAEEGAPAGEPGGAAYMLEDPIFTELDPQPTLAFGMHVIPAPAGMVGYRSGVQHASSEMIKITVTGKQVHGSAPWAGLDPLPPAATIITQMGQIYRQVDAQDAFTISIGHVEDEGRFNIVGDTVTLWGTVRCLDANLMDVINEKIARTAEHVAESYSCMAKTQFLQKIPAVVNEPDTVSALAPALAAAAGEADRVFDAPASMGYDDMSEFINRFGGMYGLLGVQDVQFAEDGSLVPTDGGRGLVPNHSPQFYADDNALITGVRMHLAVIAKHFAA